MTLPASFLTTPLAHRGLHDQTRGRPENSRAAFRAAIAAGYGIELDVQRAADGAAMVFHDYDLPRLTGTEGTVRTTSAAALGQIRLSGGDEAIPTLDEVLNLVAGQVPLLIEIKDQDGALGGDVGPLEQAVADLLQGYSGDVAVMSFNPHAVAALAKAAPQVPRGLTTCAFSPDDWGVSPERAEHLTRIVDYDRLNACFVSHDRNDLANPRLAELRASGAGILCWTIRTPDQEAEARKVADNITFEGYAPVRA
ncbi:glycerophosphodiester phosphodiesterase family protein [Oceaniglobus ichthyenteri]|uniref:glycerophosphodiester phosphodiesterase family protein n=1 Tax=Oceaniglobus ichthyenteri TaxID=2136177 RepID=UPI000D3BFAED|nr:glycerophosphodiester phosphodiesterase family protein [Oceaniglobus ichthyenteri]